MPTNIFFKKSTHISFCKQILKTHIKAHLTKSDNQNLQNSNLHALTHLFLKRSFLKNLIFKVTKRLQNSKSEFENSPQPKTKIKNKN